MTDASISDFYVTYILMRPILGLALGLITTITGYLFAASRCEQFQRNERRRFLADAIGLILALCGPLWVVWGFLPWIT
jgi:uncharacterized membrane protein YdcZ (DUF606 family)